MTTCLQNGIVWNRHKSLMHESPAIKISRVVMIATNEDNPVIAFIHPFGIAFHYIVVIPFVLKTKAAITCYDNQGVAHLVLYTDFIHEQVEIAVNIA